MVAHKLEVGAEEPRMACREEHHIRSWVAAAAAVVAKGPYHRRRRHLPMEEDRLQGVQRCIQHCILRGCLGSCFRGHAARELVHLLVPGVAAMEQEHQLGPFATGRVLLAVRRHQHPLVGQRLPPSQFGDSDSQCCRRRPRLPSSCFHNRCPGHWLVLREVASYGSQHLGHGPDNREPYGLHCHRHGR